MPSITLSTGKPTLGLACNRQLPQGSSRLSMFIALAGILLGPSVLHAPDHIYADVLEGVRAAEGVLRAVAVHRVFRYQPDHPQRLRHWDETLEQDIYLENIADIDSRVSVVNKYVSFDSKKYVEERAVWDGTASRWLQTIDNRMGDGFKAGIITNNQRFVLLGYPSSYLWWYQGHALSAMMEKYAPATVRPKGDGLIVIGFTCDEQMKLEYHVDPSRGFAVVYRARYYRPNVDSKKWELVEELKCEELREVRAGLWLPHRVEERWSGDLLGTGRSELLRADVCLVTWHLDPELDPTTFALEFPPDTLVDDQVTGKKYRVARLTDQAIADQVAAARRLAQEQGEKLASPGGARMLFAACAAIVVAGAFIVYRIKRRLKAA